MSPKVLAIRRIEAVLLLLPISWLGKVIPVTGVASVKGSTLSPGSLQEQERP